MMEETMKPGDQIEWVYEPIGKRVVNNETLWSSTMRCWAPIGSRLIHTLVSIDKNRITWMNEKGLFHAHVNDSEASMTAMTTHETFPRVQVTTLGQT